MKLFRNETKAWHHVFVDGEEIVCTGGHPFYVVGEGFVEAKNLKISDKLLLSDGRCVTIEKLEVETPEQTEITYNFEVAGFHTYYVGNGICVHNMNGENCGKRFTREFSDNELKSLGKQGKNSGVRVVEGDSDNALDFFKSQTSSGSRRKASDSSALLGENSRGNTFTYRATSSTGEPTVNVNKRIKKI